jgi:hypothetical protein
LIPSALISFGHAVFLLGAQWRGNELVLGRCRDFNAVLVADRWSLHAPGCVVCAAPGLPALSGKRRAESRQPLKTNAALQHPASARSALPLWPCLFTYFFSLASVRTSSLRNPQKD